METPPYLGPAIVDDISAADVAQLEAQLDAFNAEATGIPDARLFSIILRRADGELYGGLHGHTWGQCCQVKLLWLAKCERGRGLGSALLAAAEAEERQRGCRQIMLSTHSFQAPGFYARHGFERVAAVMDNPIGHADI
jgi:GNAT superfamily N-acetyltransferase